MTTKSGDQIRASFLVIGGNMARPFAQPFYNSKRWQHCRDSYRKHVGGLCEDCLARGIITAGAEVHHMTPITPENINDPAITLNWQNLRLLCKDCHAARHQAGGDQHKAGRRAKTPAGRRYVIDGTTGKVTPIAPPMP